MASALLIDDVQLLVFFEVAILALENTITVCVTTVSFLTVILDR